VYQDTAPSSPQTGDVWVDSDAVAGVLNQNDYLLKADATSIYETQADAASTYGVQGSNGLPLRMSAGRGNISAPATTNAWSAALAVTFPAGRFTQAPVVTVTTNNLTANPRYLKISDVTTTGFNAYQTQITGATLQVTDFDWIAIQMTSSAYTTGTAQ
jgi:hypothetical protein